MLLEQGIVQGADGYLFGRYLHEPFVANGSRSAPSAREKRAQTAL